ncbi:MAG: fimbrillin family protein [Parabacteroides gordonii]|nr:fimbrillin family protein [Parabacteroides gordonii]
MKQRMYYICVTGIGLLCALVMAGGCTSSQVEEVMPEDIRPVTLIFSRPDLGVPELLTRADDPTPLPEGATVRISAYYLGYVGEMTYPADYGLNEPAFQATYVVGTGGALTPCLVDAAGNRVEGNASDMIVRGGVYDFYAVSPGRLLEKDVDYRWKVNNLPHREDVITSYARNVAITKTSGTVTLASFTRRCAQLVFTVAPSPNNKVPMDELRATSLVLTELSRSGASLVAGVNESILKTGGEVTDAGTIRFTEDDFEPVAEEADTARLGLNKVVDEVLPKNTTAFRVALTIVRNGVPVDLSALINKSISFDEGKRYVFTLQVENDVSRLQMRVMNWNTFAFADNNVGGAVDGSHPADPDINQGVGVSFTVAEWRNIEWNGNGNVGEATE